MNLITTSQAALAIGVSRSRINKMIAAGQIRARRVGEIDLIDPKQLEKLKDRKPGRPKIAENSVKTEG